MLTRSGFHVFSTNAATKAIRFGVALCALLTLSATARAQRPIKVYISVDMEGVAGVVSNEQLGPTGFEYERFRRFMTQETLAAIRGAREAGATEIVVSDSHGNGQNLLIEDFPDDVTIIRSWPRPLGMMQGIDSSFAAAVFIGYHASTANLNGVRAHTESSANFTGVQLNGIEVPEGGLNAAIAGYYGVPIVAISGDDAAVEEVRKFTGQIPGAIVKRAISFHSASTMTPKAAQELIRQQVKLGVEQRASAKPYVLRGDVTLDLSLKNYRAVEALAYLPIVKRTATHTVRYVGKNVLDVAKFLQFVTEYRVDLTP